MQRKIFNQITNKMGALKRSAIDLALARGIVEGHKDYQKFIILGMGRTGSNMLATSFRSHSEIVSYGEIFNDPNAKRNFWEHHKYVPYKTLEDSLLFRNNDPEKFIETLVFRRFPMKISAVGFKIFYFHATSGSWKRVWDLLKGMDDLKVIHIKRRNMLRTFLSIKTAHITGQWSINSSANPTTVGPLDFTYEECLEIFQTINKWQIDYDSYFADHQKIDVFYENLVNEYAARMQQIQDFLGVKNEPLSPYTKKQNRLPLAAAISNYGELKEKFKGSRWTHFFEE